MNLELAVLAKDVHHEPVLIEYTALFACVRLAGEDCTVGEVVEVVKQLD